MPSDLSNITFLGTGTSVGVPVIGCDCEVCTSTNLRNDRTRSSILISTGETCVLIDSGPDLRRQALREKITSIDAIIYTHSHLDHVAGFDELRAFCWGKDSPLPLYATASCIAVLKNMFGWAFQKGNIYKGYVKPDPRPILSEFRIGDLAIKPLPVIHGTVETIGFLFQTDGGFRFAYLPDVKSIPEKTLDVMTDLDLLIMDCLREEPHATHLSVREALSLIDRIAPKKTLLTHISHDLDHEKFGSSLPENVSPAYDGLKVKIV